ILPPDGKYAKAAIIHDYLYDNALRTKQEADRIFLDGMTVLGVPKWKRAIMYQAVRLFGRGNYRNTTEEQAQ
ncbi:phage tail protein, partial [Salmonella enterica subsp. enterica serovar Oranienburg]|nr:phage tail protein [Salmonella enterica subsp. enterica serovar Oranienburg]